VKCNLFDKSKMLCLPYHVAQRCNRGISLLSWHYMGVGGQQFLWYRINNNRNSGTHSTELTR